jgi:hypothetical protein
MALSQDGHDIENKNPQNDEDADALLASLEEEDDSAYRAQRLQELKSAAASSKTTTATNEAIEKAYATLKGDDDTLAFTTEHERAVLHFFHPEFARCNTMDGHCQRIAEKHAEYGNGDVAFARIDVKDAPFVVEKLSVRILPCVIGFVKGVVKGRVTGFEGLCWDGKEGGPSVTMALEETFVSWTILQKRLFFGHNNDASDSEDEDEAASRRREARGTIRSRKHDMQDDDDDWE